MKATDEQQILRAVSQQTAAKLIGVSTRFLRGRRDCPRNGDGTYDAFATVQWYLARGVGEDAALATGSDSPALERWRLARAKLSELELQREQANSIDRAKIRELFGVVASHIRRGIDTLQRRCGAEAFAVMRDALADAQRVFDAGVAGKDTSTSDLSSNEQE